MRTVPLCIRRLLCVVFVSPAMGPLVCTRARCAHVAAPRRWGCAPTPSGVVPKWPRRGHGRRHRAHDGARQPVRRAKRNAHARAVGETRPAPPGPWRRAMCPRWRLSRQGPRSDVALPGGCAPRSRARTAAGAAAPRGATPRPPVPVPAAAPTPGPTGP
jgi:hypothetical protein